MNENEKKNEVVEAVLRAREKELEQLGDDGQDSLTEEEHEEMFQKIVERLKTEGLMKEDASEENKGAKSVPDGKTESVESGRTKRESAVDTAEHFGTSAPERGRNCVGKKKIRWFQRRAAKVACVCLVAGVAVFGVSMTGEANRLRLMQTVNEVLGTGDLMKTNNGEDRVISGGSEDEARKEIETKLQAEVPDFYYLPEGMEFKGYEISPDIGLAKMEYNYEGGYLYLNISNGVLDTSQGNIKENQEKNVKEIETLNGRMEFQIEEVETEPEQHMATWNYRNIVYTLGGEVSNEELIKMLEKISFNM